MSTLLKLRNAIGACSQAMRDFIFTNNAALSDSLVDALRQVSLRCKSTEINARGPILRFWVSLIGKAELSLVQAPYFMGCRMNSSKLSTCFK